MNTTTLKTVLYKTIHRNEKDISTIAEEMGISDSTLYRYGLTGESGSEMPLNRLIPLMVTTKNYSILKHIAKICGFTIVRVPKFKGAKAEGNKVVSQYQLKTNEAGSKLIKFFEEPNEENYTEVKEALSQVLEVTVVTKKYSKKIFKGQMEMEL